MITEQQRKKLDPRLVAVIGASALVHVILGLVLGGITIVDYIAESEAKFEAPDDIDEEEPPPEVKVKIQMNQQRMKMQPLKMQSSTEIAVHDLNVDLPSMSDSFTVSAGLGNAAGGRLGGSLRGGGIGMRFPDIKGFGTTEKIAHAWEGTVYLFKPKGITRLMEEGDDKIKGLRGGKRQSQKIFNYKLDLPGQDFKEGFPGVTDQFEWFAIDFEAKIFWPAELAGEYEFRVTSDDGSVLLIDRDIVVNNDGTHGMTAKTGSYKMDKGDRKFRLAYFQGPATRLGLILEYRKAGDHDWKILDFKDLIKYQM